MSRSPMPKLYWRFAVDCRIRSGPAYADTLSVLAPLADLLGDSAKLCAGLDESRGVIGPIHERLIRNGWNID